MASFKFNVATVKGCPPADRLVESMDAYGLPPGDEFGVLSASTGGAGAFGTIVRRSQSSVPQLDADNKEVTATAVEKVQVIPFAVHPDQERLEAYAGAKSSLEQIGVFFGSCLALPTLVEPVEMDVPSAIEYLMENTARCQLRSVRVSEYAHNSFMMGPYAPKFLDTEHGKDFLSKYADFVVSANVRFQGPSGKVGVQLRPNACLSYSCNEDDQPQVMSILRKLIR